METFSRTSSTSTSSAEGLIFTSHNQRKGSVNVLAEKSTLIWIFLQLTDESSVGLIFWGLEGLETTLHFIWHAAGSRLSPFLLKTGMNEVANNNNKGGRLLADGPYRKHKHFVDILLLNAKGEEYTRRCALFLFILVARWENECGATWYDLELSGIM